MDIEWAKDGKTGKLYIVQARPETVRSRQSADNLKHTTVTHHGETVVEGTAIGSDAAHGKVRVIDSVDEISTMQPGEILVADMTDPDWVPAIRIASAVVTNRGGRTCHAAIVSRELGVPCIVGTKDATERLKTGSSYTIDCSKGSSGYVYAGDAEIERTEVSLDDLPSTDTEIKLILGDPDSALACASLPVKGVGLCRQEFVVANHIGEKLRSSSLICSAIAFICVPYLIDPYSKPLPRCQSPHGSPTTKAFIPRPYLIQILSMKRIGPSLKTERLTMTPLVTFSFASSLRESLVLPLRSTPTT
mmetsp:Transcript_7119/g.13998  ORF Transcript_7119/g.13998 Transcript_7119/m.13998 type:complete len:304 (+) Transcript_7119:71-982(+)